MEPIQVASPAQWGIDLERYAQAGFDVVPARRSGRAFIAVDRPVPKGVSPIASATKYANYAMTAIAENAGLIEICAIGENGPRELAVFAKTAGCAIPIDHGCRAQGEPDVLRVLFRVSASGMHHAIEDELSKAGRRTNEAAALCGFPSLTVRLRGPMLLSSAPKIPEAPDALTGHLLMYRQAMQRIAWETSCAEQNARLAAPAIAPGSRKVRYDLGLMWEHSFVKLHAGTIVSEPGLIRAIDEMDPAALIALDGPTGPRALREGEIRFRRAFFRNVPTFGLHNMIDAKEAQIIEGDAEFVAILRRAGADIEFFGDQATEVAKPPRKALNA